MLLFFGKNMYASNVTFRKEKEYLHKDGILFRAHRNSLNVH